MPRQGINTPNNDKKIMTGCKRHLLWPLPLLLSARTTVEMPKHMVSAAVDASVKAYDSITGKPKATNQCYERVGQHGRNEMKQEYLAIASLGDSLKKRSKLFSIECRIRATSV